MYADLPGLFETNALPLTHRFVGPLQWSPQVPLPAWWGAFDKSLSVIYLTPGSSGSAEKLPLLAAALASLPATVLVATARQWNPTVSAPGVFVADFLPGDQIVKIADVVVCNGGSPTTGQALAAGVPVVGVPNNLDQYLNMTALEKAGLGITLRSGKITPEGLVNAVREVLQNSGYRDRTREVQRRFGKIDAGESFTKALAELT